MKDRVPGRTKHSRSGRRGGRTIQAEGKHGTHFYGPTS